MGTRSFAEVAPTPATIALNAYIYGYGGHSLVTPHAALKQLWWTDARIEAKVNKQFIVSKLRGEERDFLNRQLGFGEGLTDETYMEWILTKAKRLFLILTEVKVPDQIFGCVDDSWDDSDLPMSFENVEKLELAIENDDALNRKFYDTQFRYLLRELKQGSHIDYGPCEHIPMEFVNSLPPAIWDRIHFPGRADEMYMRRKYALTDKETGQDLRRGFHRDVRKAQALDHEHIASAWASYTTEDAGYMISDFIGEHTLGTFIDHRNPMQFQRLRNADRTVLLCEWMHCLSDALASMHCRGAAHGHIRPSNILIDHENRIAFADVGSIRTLQRGKKVNKTEVYDYAAPESQLSNPPVSVSSSPPISNPGVFGRIRQMSTSGSSSSGRSSNGSIRSNSIVTMPSSPVSPQPPSRTDSITAITTTTIGSPPKSSYSIRNFSRHLTHSSISSAMAGPSSPTTIIHLVPSNASVADTDVLNGLPDPSAELADLYSLGCVFLDIVTFMVRGKTNDFVKHRTSRVLSPNPNGRRSSRTDSSFHMSPDRIDTWIDMLKEDAERLPGQIYKGVPALLELLQQMMIHQATLRPSALQVRDRIRDILVGECGVQKLCCANREWRELEMAEDAVDTSDTYYQDIKASAIAAQARKEAEEAAAAEAARLAAEEGGAEGVDEDGNAIMRTESRTASMRNRRRSSTASAATATLKSWRRKFSRS
ncbi:hypothetical protein LTR09_002022 [Extremus antarcticus]|uniref:Protein kinase domain-containing protein n=1 Tax=Extremus antarcticus TaxID=702011 RepID=A0AAJ0LVE6_9PEZI|nr:hypothetical protein LTR09_002022 [Extremus antarcticus]